MADSAHETDMADLELLVAGVYMEKMQDPQLIKLVIMMHSWPGRFVLINAFKQIDFVHKASRAPAGYMENYLSAVIDATQTQQR